jgi:hypothetical protein
MVRLSLLVFLIIDFFSFSHGQDLHQYDSSAGRSNQPPLKLLHAEPLFIDLIRDLGARKGEKEWNAGLGMTDRLVYDSYEFLVEYEWAMIDILGLGFEVPVTIYTPTGNGSNGNMNTNETKPSNRVESLKMAAQYTFLVSEKILTSLAVEGIT